MSDMRGMVPNKLRARWDKTERDITVYYPNKWDGNLLLSHITQLRPELEKRGYDITTLKFEITRKKEGDQ